MKHDGHKLSAQQGSKPVYERRRWFSVRKRRIIASLVAAIAVIFGSLAVASPASADGPCGTYAPSHGRVTTAHDGDFLHVTVSFRLTQYQLDVLQHCGDYLELSYTFDGVTIDADSEAYSIYSNLPNATQDIGFHDTTFSPGISVIPTKQLQADVSYYGTVEFNSGTDGTPFVSVGFSPSHWSSWTEGLRHSGCFLRPW
jgi:hypothetical protein